MKTAQPQQDLVERSVLYRVCWKSPVTGQGGATGPMSRDQAAFLVNDEAACETSLRYWMEPLSEVRARGAGPKADH